MKLATGVDFLKTLGSELNKKILGALYTCSNFCGFIKIIFGAHGMQIAALAASGIGFMQQAALSAHIIYKYLHATE